jgi:hypothetical protein
MEWSVGEVSRYQSLQLKEFDEGSGLHDVDSYSRSHIPTPLNPLCKNS